MMGAGCRSLCLPSWAGLAWPALLVRHVGRSVGCSPEAYAPNCECRPMAQCTLLPFPPPRSCLATLALVDSSWETDASWPLRTRYRYYKGGFQTLLRVPHLRLSRFLFGHLCPPHLLDPTSLVSIFSFLSSFPSTITNRKQVFWHRPLDTQARSILHARTRTLSLSSGPAHRSCLGSSAPPCDWIRPSSLQSSSIVADTATGHEYDAFLKLRPSKAAMLIHPSHTPGAYRDEVNSSTLQRSAAFPDDLVI